ncbi:MAG: hypothetical protein QM755_01595 [Luteolibacter sp.]
MAEREFCSDRSHNAVLLGPLGELMAGLSPEDIGLVLVGSGPGSYSGTRVGIAAAQGVALAAGCPVVAVPWIFGRTLGRNRCLHGGGGCPAAAAIGFPGGGWLCGT